jgi:hypothetical protein
MTLSEFSSRYPESDTIQSFLEQANQMVTFEPDSPWEAGQVVVTSEGDNRTEMVVDSVEHSSDETQYRLYPRP